MPTVTVGDVLAVAQEMTGVPMETWASRAGGEMGGAWGPGLADQLRSAVVGQDEAAEAVAQALRVGQLTQGGAGGGGASRRPLAAFALVGRQGCGRTLLCQALAREVFGEDAVVRLNLSEYSQASAVAKLIGAPPGYVGYGRGGMLTQASAPLAAVGLALRASLRPRCRRGGTVHCVRRQYATGPTRWWSWRTPGRRTRTCGVSWLRFCRGESSRTARAARRISLTA